MTSRRIVHALLLISLMATAIVVLAKQDTGQAVRATGAWARPGVDQTAAYLRLTNNGDSPVALIGVTADAGDAEIHETQMEGDVMRMRPTDRIDIPAGESLALEPGGYHIMIMGLGEPLEQGSTLPLTLQFASGAAITLNARITHTPIPQEQAADAFTEQSLDAVQDGTYVGQVINRPVKVQDFAAPSSDESLSRLSDTNGTWRVIFFGYMHCPDFCPLTLFDYTRVKPLLGDAADDVTFMLISIDPTRDTPEAMRRYLANFDSEFVGFAPSDDVLRRIQPDYGFYYERRMENDENAVYTVDHSTRSYLLDPDGVLRASFAYDTPPEKIANALKWYIENA